MRSPTDKRSGSRLEVTMIAMFVCLLLCLAVGTTLGAAVAGSLGAVFGAMVGAVCGMLWWAAWDSTKKIPAGAELAREEQSLLCVAKGRVATANFVRDAHTGRWLDVERCSLCPDGELRCEKSCLHLIRSALPARHHPVHTDASAEARAPV